MPSLQGQFLILSTEVGLGLSSGRFPLGIPTNILTILSPQPLISIIAEVYDYK